MKDQLIRFETAKLAKEKGFNEPCNNAFDLKIYQPSNLFEENIEEISNVDEYSNSEYERFNRPTQSLLQRWLRDEKFIDVFVINSIKENCYDWEIREEENIVLECDQYFHNYEAALEDALKEALKSLI